MSDDEEKIPEGFVKIEPFPTFKSAIAYIEMAMMDADLLPEDWEIFLMDLEDPDFEDSIILLAFDLRTNTQVPNIGIASVKRELLTKEDIDNIREMHWLKTCDHKEDES